MNMTDIYDVVQDRLNNGGTIFRRPTVLLLMQLIDKLRAEISTLRSELSTCTECKQPVDCGLKATLRERDSEIAELKKELRHLIGKDFIPGLDS